MSDFAKSFLSLAMCLVLTSPYLQSAEPNAEVELPQSMETIIFPDILDISTPDSVIEVDLGNLYTASDYKIMITLCNKSASTIEMKSISSSCGCIVGVQKNQQILVGDTTEIALIISRRERAGAFRKLIRLVDSNGHEWPLGVTANFNSFFIVSPPKFMVGSSRNILVSIKARDRRIDMSRFELRSLTGFLVLSKERRLDSNGSTLQVDAILGPGIEKSLTTMVERLVLEDRIEPSSTFEVSFPIEPSIRVGLKPSSIRLSLVDGVLSGSAILKGDKDRLAKFTSGTITFSDCELQAVVQVRGRAKSVIQIEIAFQEDHVKLNETTELKGGVLSDQDGLAVCEVERVYFIESAKGKSDE